MTETGLVILAVLVFGYALLSRRLATTPITGPLIFAVAGVLLGPLALDVMDASLDDETVRLLLEITLALVLFTDATEVRPRAIREDVPLAGRLLGIGLPLTMLLGTILAAVVFTELSWGEAAILGVILAPTDAALGQAVVGNERVPERIRQTLTVESGLNDGLAVPVFGLAIAWAEAEFETGPGVFVDFALDLAVAIAVGLAVGWLGGRLVVLASDRGWVGAVWRAIAPATLAIGVYAAAQGLGASGFISAFVAGVVFGGQVADRYPDIDVFSDGAAHLLTMLSFFVFGAVVLSPALEAIDAKVVLYALLSLTVIRIVPVVLALLRTDLGWPTVGYLAWFGPRGLASIVFASTVVIETDLPGAGVIVFAMAFTVAGSIVAHGATAWAGSNAYADWWQATHAVKPDMVESGPVRAPVRRTRLGM